MSNETDAVKEMLNPQEPLIDKQKTTVEKLKFVKKGEVQAGDYNVKWNIKPKMKIGKLLQGDLSGAVEKTSLNMEFGREFKDSDVEITVKVGGNLAYLMSSPAGSANASVVITKKF